MLEYIVKTQSDRNIVIDADSYRWNATESAYEFFKKDEEGDNRKVATLVRPSDVLLIIENDNELSDFYDHYDVNEDEETDDVCLGCRFQEFLDSDEFREAVFEVVEVYNSSDDYDPANTPVPQGAQ